MARQVLPLVGMVVGNMIAPGIGGMIGGMLGSWAGNAIDPQVIQGPKIGDNGMQTSAEGVYRPFGFGTFPCMGNIIERGNRQIRKTREQQGKGGGPVVESERVYWTFAIRICEGPIAGIARIWEDEKLVYDVTPASTIQAESAAFAQRFRLYLGTEDQLPDPDLEVIHGIGDTPSYRGTAYAVFPNFDLTDQRERIPSYRWEVSTDAITTVPSKVFAVSTAISNNGVILGSLDGLTFDEEIDTGLENVTHLYQAGRAVYAFDTIEDGRVSFDGGNSWEQVTGLYADGNWVNDVAESNGVYLLVYQNGSAIGRSTDGRNFSDVTVTSRTRYSAAGSGSTFVVGGTVRSIDYSTDGGLSFSEYQLDPEGNTFPAVFSIVVAGGTFIAARNSSVPLYRSGSGEEGSWTTADHGFDFSPSSHPIHLGYYDGRTLAISNGESAISLNAGASWSAGGSHLSLNPFQRIANNSLGFYIGTQGLGLARTTTGASWDDALPLSDTTHVAATEEGTSGSVDPGKVTLSSAVSALYARVGISASKFDVSELTNEMDGVVFAGDYTIASCIGALMPSFFFDYSEHDKKGWYPKRGKPVVDTLTGDDLLDEPESAYRENAIEYPRKLHFHYQAPQVGYVPAKATTSRSSQDARVVGERSIQTPVCFGDVDETQQISDRLLKVTWEDVKGEVTVTVPDSYLFLTPADCIGLVLRDQVWRLRIERIEYNPGELKLTCRHDRQSAYTSNVTGVPLPEPTPPPPSIVGQTVFEFMDIPALVDTLDSLHYITAASGQLPAWYGASVQRSFDGGANFPDVAAEFSTNTVMGYLLDPVPAASPHYTDTTNVVRVQLYTDDELDSVTQQQFLSEGGAFALEWADSEGTHWELLQYRDASDEGDGVFALSTLLRGRLNTEAVAHAEGARFVLLDGVRSVPAGSAWIGTDLTHRAVSYGTSPEAATEHTDEFTARSQTEWPVANLFAERVGDDIVASAVPRHRFGTDDAPVQSAHHVGYRWTFDDGADSITVDTDQPQVTRDVSSLSTPVTVSVAQLNRYTGAGPAVSEEVP